MRRSSLVTFVTALVGAVPLATPCPAQLGTAEILSAKRQEGTSGGATRLSLGPALLLGIDRNQGITRSAGVATIAVDHGLKSGTNSFAQIGGFFYFKGSDNLYQIHGKYYFNRSVGVQLAYLNGSASSNDYSAHLLYNISSSTRDPQAKVPWDVQFGLGGYFPENKGGGQGDAFSGFVQLSVKVSRNLWLDTSYWGIFPGGSNSVNRIYVGLGLNF